VSKWIDSSTMWTGLSVQELEEQIALREGVIRETVGTLYPNIIKDEIYKLRTLVAERRRQDSERLHFPHDIAINCSGKDLRRAAQAHYEKQHPSGAVQEQYEQLYNDTVQPARWRKLLGYPLAALGYLWILPLFVVMIAFVLCCVPGALLAGWGSKLAGLPWLEKEEKGGGD
jgi:hypothetical protein